MSRDFRITLGAACWTVFTLCLAAAPTSGAIRYAKWNATGANNGTSWANAYTSLQSALSAAVSGDEIWVAAGTYKPAGVNGSRAATFQLKDDVGVYGGFNGTETALQQRNVTSNVTTLSGDLNSDDGPNFTNMMDNSYHVVSGGGTSASAALDGFTIRDGHGTDSLFPNDRGGGMYNSSGSPTLRNCTFTQNTATWGGAIFSTQSSPTILDSTFTENTANLGGAAVLSLQSNTEVSGCVFESNGGAQDGAGVYNYAGSGSITACVFRSNNAMHGAGTLSNQSFVAISDCLYINNETWAGGRGGAAGEYNNSNTIFTNCRFYGNQAFGGGALQLTQTTTQLINCIFSGNYASAAAGAILSEGDKSNATVINCTFSRNFGMVVGGIFNNQGTLWLNNSILWGNRQSAPPHEQITATADAPTLVGYSNIEFYDGRFGGTGMIVADPLFVDSDGPDNLLGTEDDNLRLLPGSPCIDAGDSTAVPLSVTTDLDGDPRFQDDPATPDTGNAIGVAVVDMGAYEGPHEEQAFVLTGVPVHVPEGGTATFTVALRQDPRSIVTVQVARLSGDADLSVQAGATLVFDSSSFAVPQLVTLAAAEDADFVNGVTVFRISAAGISPTDLTAIESDNEPAPPIIYVKAGANGANLGSSWIDAFTDLQTALAAAANRPGVGEIWVAAGRYTPADPAGDRHATFTLLNGVGIYGGFAGNETTREARNPAIHETILSGDLNGDDGPQFVNHGENSYHVVTGSTTDSTAVLDGFTISGGYANMSDFPDDSGAGLHNFGGTPTVRNCVFKDHLARKGGAVFSLNGVGLQFHECMFRDNVAAAGGALAILGSQVTASNCTFTANTIDTVLAGISLPTGWRPGGGGIYTAGVNGKALLINCVVTGNTATEGAEILCSSGTSLTIQGDGTVNPGLSGTVSVDGAMTIGQNVSVSAGTYTINPTGVLLIQDDVVVDLGGQGAIVSGGMLRIRDRVTIRNTQISVTRASFEGNTIIANNVITAEAGVPAGQFFIEGTVHVQGNDIYADGDRYLDLDPAIFGGSVSGNRIFVTITEGVGQTSGGLLELRGQDLNCPLTPSPCDPGAFQLAPVPPFDFTTWTIDRLELVDGAKVNLTNRFDFQPPFDSGGGSEVMYVKDLKLGAGAVLNTAFNRLYYGTLEMGPGAQFTNLPLLGFSLGNIAFNDDAEFAARVHNNNFIDYDHPEKTRIHAQRISGQIPDAAGMMQMKALVDVNTGQLVNARAKGTFAKASVTEDRIVITFSYLFCSSDGELVVSLSDVPDLLDATDPMRAIHYIEAARIRPPVAGRDGSSGTGQFATFYGTFPRGELDYLRGTYVELELQGTGACIWINDLDPQIICRQGECASFDGAPGVTEADFLLLLAEYGKRLGPSDPKYCLDNNQISQDHYVDLPDLLAWDVFFGSALNSCGRSSAPLLAAKVREATRADSAPHPMQTLPADGLLIAGKPNGTDPDTGLGLQSDAVYSVGLTGAASGTALVPAGGVDSRENGRLIRDKDGIVYQLHGERGLVRLADSQVVVPPAALSQSGRTIYIGVTPTGGGEFSGLPLADAVFDPRDSNVVYILPVQVSVPAQPAPPGHPCASTANATIPAHTYRAAARLQLSTPNQLRLYGMDPYVDPNVMACPAEAAEYNVQRLRQIATDRSGQFLFVSTAEGLNDNNWLLIYDTASAAEWRVSLVNLSPLLQAPSALLASPSQDKLYLASAVNLSADSYVYRLTFNPSGPSVTMDGVIQIHNPLPATLCNFCTGSVSTITTMAERPADGGIYAVGFTAPRIPEELAAFIGPNGQDPNPQYQQFFSNSSSIFATPTLALIPAGSAGPVSATAISGSDLALPLSMAFSGVSTPVAADFNGDGHVDQADFDQFKKCSTRSSVAYNPNSLPAGCTQTTDGNGKIPADFDQDGDVDLRDFAVFQRCYSGPNSQPTPGCTQ